MSPGQGWLPRFSWQPKLREGSREMRMGSTTCPPEGREGTDLAQECPAGGQASSAPQAASPQRHSGGRPTRGHRLSTEERGSQRLGGRELGSWGSALERPLATCWPPCVQPPARLRANPCPSCPVRLSGPLWPSCLLHGPTQHRGLAAHLWPKRPSFPLSMQRQGPWKVKDHRKPWVDGQWMVSGRSVDSPGSPVVGRMLGLLTVAGLDPKGLRSECGGFVQGVSSCNPQPVPNPFLMTVISTAWDE